MKKRYLVLEDGQVFEGRAFGADAERVGELVFTTGMCGYIETLTDPSYYGQIVLQTFPSIGNYGIIPADFEGSCQVRGYVVRDLCNEPSNFRSEGTVDEFLKERGVPGISGVDTREITRIIREHGVMNAILCDTIPESLDAVKAFRITDGVAHVSTPEEETYPAVGKERFRVALLDYGEKRNILRELCKRGCTVERYPYDTPAERILAGSYDGVMLSNGPGDPAENAGPIAELRKLFGKLPMFGICLGHQLMALSQGGETVKLKYGHRGANQPVRDLAGGRTYITSQNHGYAVVSESLKNGVVRYIQANDKTCEGVDYPEARAFSVQFHPEACAGPADTAFLFDRFCALMGGEKHAEG
ncbi:MAG: glutamine-hydrolyzing carbamoyl-phosphate synthase small subunit [Oscillospiraceae bacterium]|nr:glutamine-hydrolyzing carbamoyl-phosphate synthase small subunit [Oscillospiraceae bacterium]